MKLLFDQNISFRIIKKITSSFPGSEQVKSLGLENESDLKIWEYAKKNDFAIVTFDSDFSDFTTLFGHPPKIIWIRTGNITTDNIASIINEKSELIIAFYEGDEFKDEGCLEIE